ncbi:hypothetical protein BDQ12DRAFT_671995 [Crucibulum laeve]|uniref:Uncharacterized protein n=1 Tax=Crucibulum laeve TaxID=68775 RepID=A0A5C3LDY6_9AGAR|nr:hypothetical protein BDQ12DRAFT_671995 [Crucibulum laeve]
MGNVANMADFADTQDIEDVDQILASEFGKIKLYISAQDPQTLDISGMKPIAAEVPLSATIKPVLELLGIRYQPIKVPNQCLYVLDDEELWIVKGDYDNALKENTCIDWKKTENKFSLTSLVVLVLWLPTILHSKTKIDQNYLMSTFWNFLILILILHCYKFYHKATGFATMYDWLQDNDSALGDIAVWGYEKAVYMFQDYELWIAEAEGDKEKQDAIAAAKKKEETARSSGTTSAAVAKSHKKRKQTNLLPVFYIFWNIDSILDLNITMILNLATLGLAFLPSASALPLEQSFPEISFQDFSKFVLDNFNSDISLSTVLLVLFTMTNNTALLNLSACAQHPVLKGETTSTTNGWIKALAYALNENLKDNTNSLLTAEDISIKMSTKQLTTCISRKLNKLSQVLQLSSYNSKKQFLVLDPESTECEDVKTASHGLFIKMYI